MKLPPGFSWVSGPGFKAVAREEWIPYLERRGLFRPSRFFVPLETHKSRGKGGLLLVDGEALVIRPNRHGGALGRFLGDVYLDPNRPHRELILLWRLGNLGIPTLDPIASVTEQKTPFCKGFLITKFLQGAVDLRQFLAQEGRPRQRMAVICKAAETIRRLHDLGVFHADLQLENLLVKGEEVYIIDLDRSWQRVPLSPSLRLKNLLRLLRSAEKAQKGGKIPLSTREILAFWRAYSRGEAPLLRELKKRLRFFALRRLFWHLGWFLEGAF